MIRELKLTDGLEVPVCGDSPGERTMSHLWRDAMRFIDRMDTQQWMFVLVGMIVLGLVCMRGFGSRSNY